MPLFDSIYVRCPVCKSHDVRTDEQVNRVYGLLHVYLSCRDCGASFQARYEIIELYDVVYGESIGPVYHTEDMMQALKAWEQDESQWIRTDGRSYVVGYVPGIYQGEWAAPTWRDTSPEELARYFYH